MRLKFKNLMLIGSLCLSVNAFAQVKDKAKSPNLNLNLRKYIDTANMDLSTKPGDDFFDYADGNWVKKNDIPAKETRWGSFSILHQENTDRLKGLLTSVSQTSARQPKGSLKQRVGDLYASGMDSLSIEKRGFDPIKPDLERVSKISDLNGVINEAVYQRTNGDDAVNYGGIGAVIGHEMTHGFDDQGRQYDADGSLHDWWTKEDADKFKERANKVVEQYNAFVSVDTLHVNGKLTLGENLADLGGLNVAYAAFKKTKEGQSNKKIDGFTPDQRFFLSWAQVWRSKQTSQMAAQRVLTDPHSPEQFRAAAPVTNIDAWYKAFNVKPGDKLYKKPEDRIKIW